MHWWKTVGKRTIWDQIRLHNVSAVGSKSAIGHYGTCKTTSIMRTATGSCPNWGRSISAPNPPTFASHGLLSLSCMRNPFHDPPLDILQVTHRAINFQLRMQQHFSSFLRGGEDLQSRHDSKWLEIPWTIETVTSIIQNKGIERRGQLRDNG